MRSSPESDGSKLRIFLVRPTLGQGGADRVTLTLLRHLDRTVFAPTLVLMRSEGELLSEVPPDVDIVSLGARSLWTAWLPLVRLLRQRRPDILFSTSSGMNIPAVIAHRIAGGKLRLVISERNVLFHGGTSPKRLLLFLAKRLLYRAADRVTTVSEGVRGDMVKLLRLPPERVNVVYTPVVEDTLDDRGREPVDDPWFAQDAPVILGAGRLVPEKDFATLLRAFARVRGERPARLIILGEGPLRQQLEALAGALGIQEDVRLPGFDRNPFRYMARADVFVLSSRHEGLPGVLIQAMACGTAVVSTDCPAGPSEIITSGSDGLLVPVGDVQRMADAIERLLDDPNLRSEMGTRAAASVRRFAVSKVLDRHIDSLLPDGAWRAPTAGLIATHKRKGAVSP